MNILPLSLPKVVSDMIYLVLCSYPARPPFVIRRRITRISSVPRKPDTGVFFSSAPRCIMRVHRAAGAADERPGVFGVRSLNLGADYLIGKYVPADVRGPFSGVQHIIHFASC